MAMTAVSVMIPVLGESAFVEDTIDSLRKQTFENFEVILAAKAPSAQLREAAGGDPRFRILEGEYPDSGSARNCALTAAQGEYVIFLESGDRFHPRMLEQLCLTAREKHADIVACNYVRFTATGREYPQTAIRTEWLPAGAEVFCHEDCPDYVLRIAGSMVWNKLFRKSFLDRWNLRFDELSAFDDLSFVAMGMACAERIVCTTDVLVRSRIFPPCTDIDPEALGAAVDSGMAQIASLPYAQSLNNAVARFAVDAYIPALKKYVADFSAPSAKRLYSRAHALFAAERFAQPQLHNSELYREFLTVRKHSYDAMAQLQSKRLIVSVTTYPRRIGVVGKALQSIYAQTKKPDEVILWLAQEQFPGKEEDLPEDLIRLIEKNRLTVRWCADLKSHKKYFYAFQEYPDDLVVTIDDDLEYAPNMLAQLYASYLLYPEAVSTVRTHLMVLSRDDTFLPYDRWGHEQDSLVHIPSMQLMATSGAGTLHPPGLFRKEFFDWQAIQDNCLYADDLWLKAMELFSDVPVVQVGPGDKLRILPGTQADSLYELNFRQGYNDVQLNNIIRWTDTVFGPHTFLHKLKNPVWGEGFLDMEAFAWHTEQRRRSLHGRLRSAQRELNAARKESKDTTAALQLQKKQAEEQQAADRSKLHTTEEKLKQTEEQLRKTKEKLKQVEESKPIGRQLRALKPGKQQPMSLKLLMKRAVYCLAWVPEKALALMMRILRN